MKGARKPMQTNRVVKSTLSKNIRQKKDHNRKNLNLFHNNNNNINKNIILKYNNKIRNKIEQPV